MDPRRAPLCSKDERALQRILGSHFHLHSGLEEAKPLSWPGSSSPGWTIIPDDSGLVMKNWVSGVREGAGIKVTTIIGNKGGRSEEKEGEEEREGSRDEFSRWNEKWLEISLPLETNFFPFLFLPRNHRRLTQARERASLLCCGSPSLLRKRK